MTMDLRASPERSVAALLASALEDRPFWTSLARARSDLHVREEASARAVELYRLTGGIIPGRLQIEDEQPLDHAIGILREIADAWAMSSVEWSEAEARELRVPTRDNIELLARLYDVDVWVRGRGIALDLSCVDVRRGVPTGQSPPDEFSSPDLAGRFISSVETYRQVLDLRRSQEGVAILKGDQFRRAACAEIGQGRAWVVWTRTHLPSSVEPVALAMHFIAQATFVVAAISSADTDLFPTFKYLRKLLEKTDANEWLVEQGVELPDVLGDPS